MPATLIGSIYRGWSRKESYWDTLGMNENLKFIGDHLPGINVVGVDVDVIPTSAPQRSAILHTDTGEYSIYSMNSNTSKSGWTRYPASSGLFTLFEGDIYKNDGSSWVKYVPPKQELNDMMFVQNSEYSIARTALSKMRELVSVKDFGAKGDGSTDDTTAIQNAVNFVGESGGGLVFFPHGQYKISSTIVLNRESVVLFGESRFACLIIQTTSSSGLFDISGPFCGVKGISTVYQTTPNADAITFAISSGFCSLDDFVIRSCGIGVAYLGRAAVAGKVTNFEILDYETAGVFAQNINDLFVSNFVMNAGNETRGRLGGIRLLDSVEAFVCTDGDILLGEYSITMDCASYTLGSRPAYNSFTNIYFDSATKGTSLTKFVETDFVGCWFSNGRSASNPNPGAVLFNCRSIRFTNCRFFNCGAQGVVVQADATDITFVSCKAESNSVSSGAGVAHGFQFADNCSEFKLIGCTASNGLYVGKQGYGIFIGAGATNFCVTNCNLLGNQVGPLLDGSSSSAEKTISGNIGFKTVNGGTVTIPAGQTSIVVNHGLSATPASHEIIVSPKFINAQYTGCSITGINPTQFQINILQNAANLEFSWSSRIKGS